MAQSKCQGMALTEPGSSVAVAATSGNKCTGGQTKAGKEGAEAQVGSPCRKFPLSAFSIWEIAVVLTGPSWAGAESNESPVDPVPDSWSSPVLGAPVTLCSAK